MAHSKQYAEVKARYDEGTWGIGALRQCVVRKMITEAEYKEICGLDYEEVTNVD